MLIFERRLVLVKSLQSPVSQSDPRSGDNHRANNHLLAANPARISFAAILRGLQTILRHHFFEDLCLPTVASPQNFLAHPIRGESESTIQAHKIG